MSQGFVSKAPVGSGIVMKVAHLQTGAMATTTAVIPLDDTIPQNTEGTEFMSLAYTPLDPANLLRIDVTLFTYSNSVGAQVASSLFHGATANAVAAMGGPYNSYDNPMSFTHWMTAGSIAATTFKVRAGTHAGATLTFNGRGGSRRYGGVIASSISVTEYST